MCQAFLTVIPSSLSFSPAAYAVASESSGEITAAGRLQPGITGGGDGPAPQQGADSSASLSLSVAVCLSFVLSFTLSLCFIL